MPTPLPSPMSRRSRITWFAVGTLGLFLVTCVANRGDGTVSLEMRVPESRLHDPVVAAGDRIELTAYLVQASPSRFSEYPSRSAVWAFPWEFRWHAGPAEVATVDWRGVVHVHRAGRFTVRVEARGNAESMDFTAAWPVDSTVFRFARRSIALGDTVELFARTYYADGEVEPVRGNYPGAFRRSGWPGYEELEWGEVLSEVHQKEGEEPDWESLLWTTRGPGSVLARTTMHGRELRARLRVDPAGARPPRTFRIERPAPVRRQPQPTAGCFALQLGQTTADAAYGGDPVDTALTRRAGEMVSRVVALDSAPIIRSLPEAGRLIHVADGTRLETSRWWQALGRDSVRLFFRDHQTMAPHVDVRIDARLSPDGLHGLMYQRPGITEVRGARVRC